MTNEQPATDSLWKEFEDTEPVHPQPTEPIGEQPEASDPTRPESTQEELDKMLVGSTYVGRFDVETPQETVDAFSVLDGLRDRYGRENVVVSGVSVDPDTQQKVHVPGKLGMWVDTAAKEMLTAATILRRLSFSL